MEGQITLDLTDILSLIKTHAKSHAGRDYIAQESLRRIVGGPDVVNNLIKDGFLMELGKEGYQLTRKLNLYDPNEKVQFDGYGDLVGCQWGKLGSFI